ncbi:NADPH-dependent FMN reductase [Flavobacterium adhaerens]|uniref:NADPH-dependent FMN reductase n=1 Tax=Flavobacterium adhaerens TaxID=3149043 RepID=UPI0032B3AECA
MITKKTIFIIIGSASANSVNEKIIHHLVNTTTTYWETIVFKDLKSLPHFDPELSIDNTPQEIISFRNNIEKADGVIICTPEYIFSIPSGLKNAIEWCVSTTLFTDKPTGLLTASASGEKGHAELQLIFQTLMAKFTDQTTLLIQGAKGKINEEGNFTHEKTKEDFYLFLNSFKSLL